MNCPVPGRASVEVDALKRVDEFRDVRGSLGRIGEAF